MSESRGGRSRLLVHNSPYGLCGRKATFQEVQELCVSRGGRPGLPVPYGLCGRKATLNLNGNPLLSILREFVFFRNFRPSEKYSDALSALPCAGAKGEEL